MEKFIIKLSLLMCVIASGQELQQLPEYLQELRCHKGDAKFDSCILQNYKLLVPYLEKGIPELNIPPIDPYILDMLVFDRSIGNDIKVRGLIKDLIAHGAGNHFLDSFKSDDSRTKLEMKLRVPWFNVSVDYDVGGDFFGIPFKNEGSFEGTFTNIRIYLKVSLDLYKKDGEQYLKVEQIRPKLKIGDGHIDISTKDPAMQSSVTPIVTYFNNNPSGAMEIAQRFMEQYSDDEFLRDTINNHLTLFPASEFLPD